MTDTPTSRRKVVTAVWPGGDAWSRITVGPGFQIGNRHGVKNTGKTALVKFPAKHLVVSKPAAAQAPMVLSLRPKDEGLGPNARGPV